MQSKVGVPIIDDAELEHKPGATGPPAATMLAVSTEARLPLITRYAPPQFEARVVRRLAVGNVEYQRGDGGTLAEVPNEAPFGAPAPNEQAHVGLRPIAFVANVPTAGLVSQVATRYAEGWSNPEERRKRQRLVVGVNTFQSLGEDLETARQRANQKLAGNYPDGTVGKAVVFVWRPNWSSDWPAQPLHLNDEQKIAEKTEALEREKMPYGLFRSTILSSQATADFANDLNAKGYEPYIHVADPDAPSFKVPQGRQRPGGNKVYMSGEFATESEEVGLFDRLSDLINRRVTRVRPNNRPPKPLPSVVAGGYQLRDSSAPNEAIPLSKIASQIDMQVRGVLFSKGVSPMAAYLPEPNLAVRWTDVPKQVNNQQAANNLFGGTSGESPQLMQNMFAASNLTLDDFRQRVAFKPAAAIATGATGQGERFRARTEQPVLRPNEVSLAAGMSLEEKYRSVLRAGQSHANPSMWPGKAVHAADINANSNAGKTRVLQRARYHLKNPGDDVGTVISRNVISDIAGQGEKAQRPKVINQDQDTRLQQLARETVNVIGAYEALLEAQ